MQPQNCNTEIIGRKVRICEFLYSEMICGAMDFFLGREK